jgi:hypothetical protein
MLDPSHSNEDENESGPESAFWERALREGIVRERFAQLEEDLNGSTDLQPHG